MTVAVPSPESVSPVRDCVSGSPYCLTDGQVSRFWSESALGPLPCEAPELEGLLERLHGGLGIDDNTSRRNVYDPQLHVNIIHQLARHPSIIHPVAQLLDHDELSFFQARFRVKSPLLADLQPWHQDVGKHHGGLSKDGSPIPSLTVWLSLDGADATSGAVVLLPGTHSKLLGHWQDGFHGLKGLQHTIDARDGRLLETPPNHFHIFHSWAVHRSLTNNAERPRSALILRYMDQRYAMDASFPHFPCNLF